MYRKTPKGWAKHWDFILLDEAVLLISFLLSYFIRQGFNNPFLSSYYRMLFFLMFLVELAVASVFNTFSGVLKRTKYRVLIDTIKHVSLVLVFNSLFTFVTQTGARYSRAVLLLTAAFHLVLGYGVKLWYRHFRLQHHSRRSMFVVTTLDRAESTIENIRRDITSTIHIAGMAVVDQDMVGKFISEVPVCANVETVANYLAREWVDEIYFNIPRDSEYYDTLFSSFMAMGITVHVDIGRLPMYYEQKQEVERIGKSVVMTTAINSISGMNLILKRVTDILGGLIGSLMALLIMAAVAIPLKKASPGPLLYTSERIGLNGKRFRMYKIRSMYLDADERKASLMKENRNKDGMMFKLDWDPRIIGNETLPDGSKKTGIGEFIRKTSLDEFPQFFNVLKGDMSLVGTRPPTPDEWEKYEAHHRARMATKPGITGMWQASGRSEITDFEEVVRLDTQYITNWSLGLDVKLLFKTLLIVVTGKGAM